MQEFSQLLSFLSERNCSLVAVSKTKSAADILRLYEQGQRDFGENYVQELLQKQQELPADIRWHFIGHLQTNKVKQIASFVHLIHGVDSEKLLTEINKQAKKFDRRIDCLLQMHIAREETKFGMDRDELSMIQPDKYENVRIRGLMGMASFSDDENLVRNEFRYLRMIFDDLTRVPAYSNMDTLSMGMSADFKIAIEEGSTMVRIGSLLFGKRDYSAN